MKTITIPKELVKRGDLVLIPRQDYEQLLKRRKVVPLTKLTPSEKKALERGRRDIEMGEHVPLDILVHELAYRC